MRIKYFECVGNNAGATEFIMPNFENNPIIVENSTGNF